MNLEEFTQTSAQIVGRKSAIKCANTRLNVLLSKHILFINSFNAIGC